MIPTFFPRSIVIAMGVILAFPVPVLPKVKSPGLGNTTTVEATCTLDAAEVVKRMIGLSEEIGGEYIDIEGERAQAFIKKLDDMQVRPHLAGDALLIVMHPQGSAAVASFDTKKKKFCGKVIILPPAIFAEAVKATGGLKAGNE
jgi:hypothetical protein